MEAVRNEVIFKTEFERFETSVRYWVQRLGLNDWLVNVRQEDLGPDREGTRSRAVLNWSQRKVAFVWNTVWCDSRDVTALESPEANAFHEVVHCLLNPLVHVSAARGAECDEGLAEEHAIIQRLAKALNVGDQDDPLPQIADHVFRR